MVAITPGLLMVVVRQGFRLGHELWQIRNDRIEAATRVVAAIPVTAAGIESAALQRIYQDKGADYPTVFNLADRANYLLPNADPVLKARLIQEGIDQLTPNAEIPEWVGGDKTACTALAIQVLRSPEARRRQWTRFGVMLVQTGLQAIAAQPNITGLGGRAETLLSAFASKVDTIIGPDGEVSEAEGASFRQRAAAVLLQASLSTLAENPSAVVSEAHWAEFVGAVLSPLAQTQANQQGQLVTFEQLRALMRGPMAHAALTTLHARQTDFFGERFKTDKAIGSITQEILSAAVAVPSDQFDIRRAFSQRGLTVVYTAALDAAAKRPELFIGEGRDSTALRELLVSVSTTLRNSPPPFDAQTGLGDRLAVAVIDVAANHLSRTITAEFAGATSWSAVGGRILQSIVSGFQAGLQARATGAAGARVNPFVAVFNQDQVVDIVRIIADQAARTPQMLLGTGQSTEIYAIAKAVAAFMSDPATRLASPDDWRAIIAVALDEAAKNPGTLFQLNAEAGPESHLAVSLIGRILQQASAGLRQSPAGATARRRGSVLFSETLREAITMTLRAAANNATALLDNPRHIEGLDIFVRELQTFTERQNGRVGAAEYLWLYRTFIAEAIDKGPAAAITSARLEEALRSLGLPAPPAPVSSTESPPVEETTP